MTMGSAQSTRGSIHRWPGEESVDLYPGLVVSDGKRSRVTGSITVGRTRLPVWAFTHMLIDCGFDAATEDYYNGEDYEVFGKAEACTFFHSLMELRGEFGRLLLVLADAERCEPFGRKPWYMTKRHNKRVSDQLRRCLAVLEANAPDASDQERHE